MPSNFVGLDVYGLDEVQDTLDNIPIEARGGGVEASNEYLVNVFQTYPPRASHGPDNPYQWQTEKQRRAFFATGGFGRGIPSQRTQGLRRGWETLGEGVNQIVVNENQAAPYTVGEFIQRGHVADGWKKLEQTVAAHMSRLLKKFEAGVAKALKKYS